MELEPFIWVESPKALLVRARTLVHARHEPDRSIFRVRLGHGETQSLVGQWSNRISYFRELLTDGIAAPLDVYAIILPTFAAFHAPKRLTPLLLPIVSLFPIQSKTKGSEYGWT